MADVRANSVAAIASLPPRSGSKARQGSLKARPESRASVTSMDSQDTLTEAVELRQKRNQYVEVLNEAGPRGRALREARDRGLL